MAQKQSKKSSNVKGFISSFGFSREGKDTYTTNDLETDNRVNNRSTEEEDAELERFFRETEKFKVSQVVSTDQEENLSADLDASALENNDTPLSDYKYLNDINSDVTENSFVVDEIDHHNYNYSDSSVSSIDNVSENESNTNESDGESNDSDEKELENMDDIVDKYIENIIENNINDCLVMQTEENEQVISTKMTHIAAGSEINGSLSSTSDVLIEGVIIGNITCEGNAIIKGKVTGDIKAYYIEINCADVAGAIEANDNFKLVEGSITGDIMAKSISIDGKVEGNVLAENTCEICSNAIVKGDITASSVSIANNSIINGKLSINRAITE